MKKINELNNKELAKELKEQFKLLNEGFEDIKNLREKIKKADKEFSEFIKGKNWLDITTNDEYDKTIKEYSDKQKELEFEEKKENFNIDLTKNNIMNILNTYFENNIIDILKKYQNKNIGEKTKEKIIKEVNEKVKNDFRNVEYKNSYFRIYKSYDWQILFEIDDIKVEYTKYNSCDKLSYFYTYKDYILDKKDGIKVFNDRLKNKEKIDKLKKEIEKLQEETNTDLLNSIGGLNNWNNWKI